MGRNSSEITGDRIKTDVLEGPQGPQSQEAGVLNRRALLSGSLATLALASIPFGDQEALAQTPSKNPYDKIRTKVHKELDAGKAVGGDLGMILHENPRLYYEHDVKNGLAKKHLLTPTPSMVFEAARHCWLQAAGQAGLAADRTISLDKLALAAQPGVPQQQYLKQVHRVNTVVNNKMLHYWLIIARDAAAIAKTVQALVKAEESAAKAKKTPSAAKGLVFPGTFIPLGPKDPALVKKHKKFKDYSTIEPQLRPAPYECDTVSLSDAKPSSIMELESAKAVKVLVEQHLAAAIQRKQCYAAIQAFLVRYPKLRGMFSKYDGSSQNDKILAGWADLIRPATSGSKKGDLLRLLDKIIYTLQLQTKYGETLQRCKNP